MARACSLPNLQVVSTVYHGFFKYPLRREELVRWEAGKSMAGIVKRKKVYCQDDWVFLKGGGDLVKERKRRFKLSKKKLKIARRASGWLKLIPFVMMVGVTGSLAMENTEEESDIDLMVVARRGTMWTTRLLVFFILKVGRFDVRRWGKLEERDMLCINIFVDAYDMKFSVRGTKLRKAYVAHEIAQIIPIVNKRETYERMIVENLWIEKYWPNSLSFDNYRWRSDLRGELEKSVLTVRVIETVAYFAQQMYMRGRIKRETITRTRAFFHPRDWAHEMEKGIGV